MKTLINAMKDAWAFFLGVITFNRPYHETWDSFSELAHYDLGRSITKGLFGRDEYE